jgi:hypothetical protein
MLEKIKHVFLAVVSVLLLGGTVFATVLMGYILSLIGITVFCILIVTFIYTGIRYNKEQKKK